MLQWDRIKISSLCGKLGVRDGGMRCNELAKMCAMTPKKGGGGRGWIRLTGSLKAPCGRCQGQVTGARALLPI